MPEIYLSPSTQEFNPVNGGGNEELYMNLIADAMIPYLNASGIRYKRNTPDMTVASSISESNSGNYDLHLALHSNAAAGEKAGKVRGTEVYYYPSSSNGQRAAEIIANNLKLIYPLPQNVKTLETVSLGEVARTKAPGVLIEFAYHDNYEDALWIRNNINAIAQNVVLSLADYFDIPFIMPGVERSGRVSTEGGNLNIRNAPSVSSSVLVKVPNGATVKIYSDYGNWRVIDYNGVVGYANAKYIREI